MGFKTLHPLIQVFPLSHVLQLHSNFFSHIKLELSPKQTTLSHLHAFEMLFSFPLPYLLNFQSTNSSTDNSITLFSSRHAALLSTHTSFLAPGGGVHPCPRVSGICLCDGHLFITGLTDTWLNAGSLWIPWQHGIWIFASSCAQDNT